MERRKFLAGVNQRRLSALQFAAEFCNASVSDFKGWTQKKQKSALGGMDPTERRKIMRHIHKKYRPSLKPNLRRRVFTRDNCTCCYCGKNFELRHLTIDHRYPVSKGGSNNIDNLVTSCFPCNKEKAAEVLP
eukprot:jgi/Bigna1/61517/fgenesh1_kg.22_\